MLNCLKAIDHLLKRSKPFLGVRQHNIQWNESFFVEANMPISRVHGFFLMRALLPRNCTICLKYCSPMGSPNWLSLRETPQISTFPSFLIPPRFNRPPVGSSM